MLRSVEPDCVVVTSLIYSLGSDVVTCMSNRDAAPDLESRTAMIVYDLIPFLFPAENVYDPVLMRYYRSLDQLRRYDVLLAISDATRRDCHSPR